MRESEVQHLPVCEAGKVVGVISLADIAFGRPDEEGHDFSVFDRKL